MSYQANKKAAKSPGEATPADKTQYSFHLIVSGSSLSALALFNLRKFCEERLAGRYRLKISNLVDQPKLAKDLQIAATPLLIREEPGPKCRFIGSMTHLELVLLSPDLMPGGVAS